MSKANHSIVLPEQDPRWPNKDHFEEFITSGPFKGTRRCQSWNSKRSKQCGNVAATGFDKCAQSHGGKASSGRPITNGRGSKYLPKQKDIEAALKQFMEDPELTGLRREIAAICVRQDDVLASIKSATKSNLDPTAFWNKWDELAVKKTALTIAENKRQAQLASNLNARQAIALKTIIISLLSDVVKDDSVPRSQIPKVVGLKLIQQMSRRSGARSD